MYTKNCCVPGCENRTESRHRFPRFSDEERFEVWKRVIAAPRFAHISNEHIYKVYRICNCHFSDDCFSPGTKRLNANSIPTLILPVTNEAICESGTPTLQAEETTASAQSVGGSNDHSASISVGETRDLESNSVTSEEIQESDTPILDCLSLPARAEEISMGAESDRGLKRTAPSSGIARKKKLLHSLLAPIGSRTSADLTPKAKSMYRTAQKLKRLVRYHSKKKLSFKRSRQKIRKLTINSFFDEVDINPIVRQFFISQLRNSGSKPKGRRYTMDDKVLALALYKNSRRGYRMWRKLFHLPSKKVLLNLLKRLPFQPGINEAVFAQLKSSVEKLKPSERMCVLMFDEMAVEPGIRWNETSDTIVGFEDYGHRREPQFADHALVFMVRGITRKWKQPVSYMYTKGTISSSELVYNIKEVIRQLHLAGLQVVATVCDQGSTNMAAINSLKNSTRESFIRKGEECRSVGFFVDDKEVIPLFDPPHLLKGIRNNLLKYYLMFIEDGVKKVARWKHVEQLYNIDAGRPRRLRACPKLTEQHVNKDKLRKMKVSTCAQVFSHTVSTAMRYIAERPVAGMPGIDMEATQTADLLLFFDELFDSLNGTSLTNKDGKIYRTSMTKGSPHLRLWRRCLQVLGTMKFYDKDDKPCNVHSIKNFIVTLEGLIALWNKLSTTRNLKHLATRCFNQDPVENFFGSIRAHGIRNVNPSCTAFANSFKSLLINNFNSAHAVSSNCEVDNCSGALDTLKNFVMQDVEASVENDFIPLQEDITQDDLQFHDKAVMMYVAGFVVKKMRQKFQCHTCRNSLSTAEIIPEHGLINIREYSSVKLSLQYPTLSISEAFLKSVLTIFSLLPKICHYRGFGKFIKSSLLQGIPCELTTCEKHKEEFNREFVNVICRITIHFWCKTVNRILSGTHKPVGGDSIQEKAHTRFLKFKKNKK